jgi:hypothetical protein
MLTAIRQTGESLIDLADQVMMRDSEQKTDDEYTCSDFAQKLNKLYSPQAQSKKN